MSELCAFACRVVGSEHETVVHETSRGRAKSQFVRDLDIDGIGFTDIRSRNLGKPMNTEGISRVAKHRGVPFAKAGMRVQVGQSRGHIVGHNSSANFDVLFDEGPYKGARLNCHPRWEMVYFDDAGNVLFDFREPKGSE
jgi:hypothetical protein